MRSCYLPARSNARMKLLGSNGREFVAHPLAATRSRRTKHQHYLRGTLYCAKCGGRLLYSRHRGNGGMYEYFCCIKRSSRQQGGRCDSRHYSVPQVEQAIGDW